MLLVSKTTNLERHGREVSRRVDYGYVPELHMQRLQQAHDDHYLCLNAIRNKLTENAIDFEEVVRGRFWPDLKTIDLIITVGGDGTILEASHHVLEPSIHILGVCSSSYSVGYLCAGTYSDLDTLFQNLLADKLNFYEANRLEAQIAFVQTGGFHVTQPVLNDFLFANHISSGNYSL